jgi:hypothetical protein
MKIHQVDATTDFEWKLLVTPKTKVDSKEATQHSIAEASLLTRKWQEKVGNFQGLKEKALDLVP